MKVFDGFLYSGELDMLELRLRCLDAVVDRFVIAEATTTFQGNPRAELLADHRDRFAPWWDKIEYILIDDLPTGPDTWAREHFQRDVLKRGLSDLRGHDLFLLSDVDEIPTEDAIRSLPLGKVAIVEMSMHPFCVDWLHPEPWAGTVSCCGRDLKDISVLRYARERKDFHHVWGGRHFTWLGGETATNTKLHSFAHSDIIPIVEQFGLERFRREGWHVNGTKLAPIEVDETFPKWIQDRECPAVWFRNSG